MVICDVLCFFLFILATKHVFHSGLRRQIFIRRKRRQAAKGPAVQHSRSHTCTTSCYQTTCPATPTPAEGGVRDNVHPKHQSAQDRVPAVTRPSTTSRLQALPPIHSSNSWRVAHGAAPFKAQLGSLLQYMDDQLQTTIGLIKLST